MGNIYAGRVENVLPGMQAAFVNIGLEKNAYLSVADIPVDKSDLGIDEKDVLRNASIKTLLRPGQEILVQGIKEPGGTKGARISATLHCQPLLRSHAYGGLRWRIAKNHASGRARAVARFGRRLAPAGHGNYCENRRRARGRSKIARRYCGDAAFMGNHSKPQRYGVAPALLHRDLSLIYQAVRDRLAGEDVEMLIENEAQYRAAREVASMFSPECESRVRFYEGNEPLFEQYGIDHQMEKAYERRVWLKSGGYW